jgi:nicotinate phosphoribosyltransferase
VQTFRFSPADVAYLRTVLPPTCDPSFFAWLSTLDGADLKIYAVAEGTVVFPRVPLLRIEGPLAIAQLLETTVLNLTNFASLVATNAARFRLAAGADKEILEFGLRRAQGPDGAMSATRYAYMGGCDGTSNVAGGAAFGMVPRGTHAHSMVSAYLSLDELPTRMLARADGSGDADLVALALKYKQELGFGIASLGELAAFVSFAQAFPTNFLALVDTYDTLQSGVPNFICVALALRDLGYSAVGIRLDSGDLAYLSKEARSLFVRVDAAFPAAGQAGGGGGVAPSSTAAASGPPPSSSSGRYLEACKIVASNDINEAVLLSLNDQGHEIDVFGIGTNLVTCQAQPALGMVYKLVEIKKQPRIKLSQDMAKVTIPGSKEVYRLIGGEGVPLMDLIIRAGETRPAAGKRILCRHPFDEKKRAYVTPAAVIPLLRLVWKGKRAVVDDMTLLPDATTVGGVGGGGGGAAGEGSSSAAAAGAAAGAAVLPAGVNLRAPFPPLSALKGFVTNQLALLREDHLRPLNPTPYKVSVSMDLYHYIHDLWMQEIPVAELS